MHQATDTLEGWINAHIYDNCSLAMSKQPVNDDEDQDGAHAAASPFICTVAGN
jgi:hypothetical protein